MSVLRGSTYNLVLGDSVRAKVRAHNQYGFGAESAVNSAGVAIQTAPAGVTGLVVGPSTSENQIELIWAALTTSTETGGATILSYNL
jgi:hypothetical protein